jgi:hypothetical protein
MNLASAWRCCLHAALYQVPGAQDKGSQACFSPVFDLELDAKLGASSNHLDRCYSHQQLGEQLAPAGSLLQQMLTLCRCSSPVQAQVGCSLFMSQGM